MRQKLSVDIPSLGYSQIQRPSPSSPTDDKTQWTTKAIETNPQIRMSALSS